jgi:hypothetical protein
MDIHTWILHTLFVRCALKLNRGHVYVGLKKTFLCSCIFLGGGSGLIFSGLGLGSGFFGLENFTIKVGLKLGSGFTI